MINQNGIVQHGNKFIELSKMKKNIRKEKKRNNRK
jgi:hypothetical protein